MSALLATGSALPGHVVANGSTALHRAAEANCSDPALWRALIEGGVPVNALDAVNRTALAEAAASNHAPAVALLLGAGAEAHHLDSRNYTALLHAVRLGALESAEALLEAGVPAHAPGPTGGDALHTAAFENSPTRLLTALVRRGGAAPSGTDTRGFTPAHWAAREGHARALADLLALGANASAVEAAGRSPLHFAAFYARTEAVRVLLAAEGVDAGLADGSGGTPLMLASKGGHEDIAVMLLAAGASVHTVDRAGGNALHYAAFEGRPTIVQHLIEAGADIDVKNSDGHSPLVRLRGGGLLFFGSLALYCARHTPPLHASLSPLLPLVPLLPRRSGLPRWGTCGALSC